VDGSPDRPLDGGALAARTLAEAGVEVVFALHGGHLDTFLTGCRRYGIRLVDFRHEAAAVNAADGYARLTGRLGVAAVTSGPGLTNGLAGITAAAADRVPILIVTSSPPTREAHTLELQGGLDLVAMLGPVTSWAERVLAVERVPDYIGLAVRRALRSPQGPTVIDLPIDVAFTPIAPERLPRSGSPVLAERPVASATSIEAAAEVLQSAERPVAVIGEAGFTPDVSRALLRFAEAANVPVFNSTTAPRALPGDHPLHGGTTTCLGFMGEPPDVVLLVGARQGMFIGGRSGGLVPQDARVVQLSDDAAEVGRLFPVEVGVVGDCAASLDALADARSWPDRPDWCARPAVARAVPYQLFPDAGMEPDGIHPFRVAKEVAEAVDPDTIVLLDGGESAAWANWALASKAFHASLNLGYQGHLGMGQGWAIAAQIAHPDKRVVQVTGDGAIGFHLPEWDTMVRYELPIVTVVFNNACWGMSIHGQQAVYGPEGDVISRLAPTRYDQVAEGFGAHGESVEKAEDLGPAIQRALDAGRPAVVNVATSASIVHPVTTALLGDLEAKDEIVVPYYQNIPK
jgi:acetolactate synthase-1/2/3 large subunit